ncbi:MAG: hypothetical protein K2X43_01005 [Hyphomonadaceae bacterium]|jgi:hypothetical protein|nr:hypothetical protein [Hyphomonadaceae bacterium]
MALAMALALIFAGPGGSRGWAQGQTKPVVSVAPVIQARSAKVSALPIQLAPASQIPRQAFLRIRGLPPTVALSEGHSIAMGAWAVPLAAVPRLQMEVPVGSEGKSEIAILLVSVDGVVLEETKSTLVIVPGEQADAAPPAAAPAASALRMQIERPPGPGAAGPELAPGDRERALKMVQRGNELITARDFSAAQHFYKRAAEIGLPEAALALARTYDPAELARLGAVGLRPDPDTARTWYERARALGSTEADELLSRLSAVR